MSDQLPNQDGPNTYKMDAPISVTSWTVIKTNREVPSDDGRRMERRAEWWHVPTFVVEAIIGPAALHVTDTPAPDLDRRLALAHLERFIDFGAGTKPRPMYVTTNGIRQDMPQRLQSNALALRAALEADQ